MGQIQKLYEKVVILIIVVSFLYFNLLIVKEVNKKVKSAFVDEIFHIPQAQRYCMLDFDNWDPKITTLPGLYLISVVLLKPLEWLWGFPVCTTYGLRLVNFLGTFINFVLSYIILSRKNKYLERWSNFLLVLSAVNVAILPPLFFFTFLYYTDVWAATFVLLMYVFYLTNSHVLASLAGVMAIFMRQTNVVWVGFMLINLAWNELTEERQVTTFQGILQSIPKMLNKEKIKKAILITMPYLLVCVGFVIFVIVNRGIVVGDKTAHSPVFHPMQFLYFLDVTALFAAPFALFEVFSMFQKRPSAPILCTLWMFCALLSQYNFLEHPYLLADNRHIAFYLWRRVFGHKRIRLLLTPTYVFSGLLLYRILIKRRNLVYVIALVVCTIISLVPQYLFEIRYFIIPYLMMRLNFSASRQQGLAIVLETLLHCAINYFVIYLFLTRTFYWDSEPGQLQRIMW